jgi:hypothetical protein
LYFFEKESQVAAPFRRLVEGLTIVGLIFSILLSNLVKYFLSALKKIKIFLQVETNCLPSPLIKIGLII